MYHKKTKRILPTLEVHHIINIHAHVEFFSNKIEKNNFFLNKFKKNVFSYNAIILFSFDCFLCLRDFTRMTV